MTSEPNDSKRAPINNLCPQLECDEAEVARLIEILDTYGSFDAPSGELSIAFVSKEEIARLHEDFMQDPSPTDVITFPGDPSLELAGELCVCPEVAHEYATLNGLDFAEELSLYLAHGYLHLCGFDDLNAADRPAMRTAEAQAMQLLKERQAIPSFRFRPSGAPA